MDEVRLLLRGNQPKRDVAAYASLQRWTYDGMIPGRQGNPTEYVWIIDSGNEAHYCESELFAAQFLGFYGPRASVFAADASGRLDCWKLDELIQQWDEAIADSGKNEREIQIRIRLVRALVIAAPPCGETRVLLRILQALEDPEPSVRHASIFAATFSDWPEVYPKIASMAIIDPNSDVQKLAARITQANESRMMSDNS